MFFFFFFFKQKTAYEMRISDWSSDVCSSDLAPATPLSRSTCTGKKAAPSLKSASPRARKNTTSAIPRRSGTGSAKRAGSCDTTPKPDRRSEEHTSELQSLMRISYAVFCLNKKNNINNTATHQQHFQSYTLKHN